MTMKKLGVLGGMGPEATSLFFHKLVLNTVAKSDQEHIDTIIINHATLPDRTTVIKENRGDEFLRTVKANFELFEQAKVDHIAIPCNTSHYFYEEMQKMTDIKIIHMVEETVKILFNKYGKGTNVAILATEGTIRTKIYEKMCQNYGLQPIIPDQSTQNRVMNMIYQVKEGIPVVPEDLEKIIFHKLEKENCSTVILGCTELSTIPIKEELLRFTIDPLEVLVHTSIILSNKESKLTPLFENKEFHY